ncbi:MAG: O-antigen translocase [Bacteroidota bacterium]|nr:O-antigen translocase [Bacteroidota bacterium]
MNLLKTSFYTSISTAITFISGFIVVKVVAVKIGPKGIAFVGQFQNTTAILTMLATAAISTGVIKYLAEHKSDPEKRKQIINTAFLIVFFSSLIISLFVISTSGYLSEAAFKTKNFWIVYFLFGLFTMAISFNVMFSAILNGLKEIRKFTIANICSSLTGVTITVIFAYTFGLKGVLIASTATAIVVFLINIYFFNKLGIRWKPDFKSWDNRVVKMLSGFSLMAIVSGFVIPTMQILVRDRIILQFSVADAGYWQAVTKISDYYLGFITSVLGVYYMPRLSELKSKAELRHEIMGGYKIILPIVGAIAFLIWLFKDLIIHILFTPEFLPMKPLFTYQLLGDFFKIGSWLLGYLMIAKAMTRAYIATEIIFAATYVALSYYFMDQYGIIGATYSFCINYLLYWILMWVLMKNKLKS